MLAIQAPHCLARAMLRQRILVVYRTPPKRYFSSQKQPQMGNVTLPNRSTTVFFAVANREAAISMLGDANQLRGSHNH